MSTTCQTYRIEADIVRDGLPRTHSANNVSHDEAQAALSAWRDHSDDGLTFVQVETGTSWLYFWHEIRDLRVTPEH